MKVADLQGALLDYWVALAEGWEKDPLRPNDDLQIRIKAALRYSTDYFLSQDGYCYALCGPDRPYSYSPSTDWAIGGPIIERERIHLEPFPGGDEYPEWSAFEQSDGWGEPAEDSPLRQFGETALIAAMRAYVASKFGRKLAAPLVAGKEG